jgi:hypothetical protein
MLAENTDVSSGLTGLNNIRSECQTNSFALTDNLRVSVDWLRFRFCLPKPLFDECLDFIQGQLQDLLILECGTPGYLGKLFGNVATSPLRIRVLWDVLPDGHYKGLIDIPATPLRRFTVRDSWRLCLGMLNRYDAECSRFDIALDDSARRISSEDLVRICGQDDYALVESFCEVRSKKRGKNSASTIYLGSRESEKFLRFYSAEALRNQPWDRWEAELKRRHANEAFKEFCSIPLGQDDASFDLQVAQFLGSVVTGIVDFVHSETGDRYERRERYDFWQQMIDEISGAAIRLSPVREDFCLEKSLLWFKRQVSVTVAALRRGWGHGRFMGWLDTQLCDGEKRFTGHHQAVVELLSSQKELELAFPTS